MPSLTFILAASVTAALAFGMAPALQTTRSRLVEANRGDFSSDYRPARLRNVLLATQVAICSLLLIVTAVVMRSQHRVAARTIGLDLNGVWDVKLAAKYQAKAAQRLAETPGVETVAVAWHAPLYGSDKRITLVPSGSQSSARTGYDLVSAGYFSLFRIPILRGRSFTDAESGDAGRYGGGGGVNRGGPPSLARTGCDRPDPPDSASRTYGRVS